MVKHTQTIRQILPRNCLNLLDHFEELTLKGLSIEFSFNLLQGYGKGIWKFRVEVAMTSLGKQSCLALKSAKVFLVGPKSSPLLNDTTLCHIFTLTMNVLPKAKMYENRIVIVLETPYFLKNVSSYTQRNTKFIHEILLKYKI